MRIAVCLAVMVLCANATTNFKVFPPMNLKPARNLVSVLTQVEAQIKSGGPLEIINEVLDGFQHEIVQEQAAHDELHARATTECESEFDFRRREVNDANSALKEGETTLAGCTDQLRRAQADLKFVTSSDTETQQYYAELLDRRAREAADFESEKKAYEHDSAALDGALDILEEIFEGEADFIQLARHSQKMLKSAIASGNADKYAGAFTALASLANSQGGADSELLDRLKNVLANVREALEAAFEESTNFEAQNQEAFDSIKATLGTTITELAEHKAALEEEIAALNKCNITQTGIVASATSKRDRNQNLWDDAVSLCDAQDAEYENAKGQRREELDIIDAMRVKVNQRYNPVPPQ
jgi:exonuclease VII small subunit